MFLSLLFQEAAYDFIDQNKDLHEVNIILGNDIFTFDSEEIFYQIEVSKLKKLLKNKTRQEVKKIIISKLNNLKK